MIHIFDIDYTVIKKPSAWYFLREALRGGIIHISQVFQLPFEWIRYALGRPNMDFIDDAVKHIAGVERLTLEQTAQECFRRRMKSDIYRGAAQLIEDAKKRGERVIFATSSLYTIIQPLEKYFGIECSIASRMEFIEGKSSGAMIGGSLFGQKKKIAVESWLGKNGLSAADVRFYSDSYTDLPLMEVCGKPVAVNPDRTLAKRAKERGWELLKFKETLGDVAK